MKVILQLVISLDEDHLIAGALRSGRTLDVVAREVAGYLECLAHDSIRWRDAVDQVGSSASVVAHDQAEAHA